MKRKKATVYVLRHRVETKQYPFYPVLIVLYSIIKRKAFPINLTKTVHLLTISSHSIKKAPPLIGKIEKQLISTKGAPAFFSLWVNFYAGQHNGEGDISLSERDILKKSMKALIRLFIPTAIEFSAVRSIRNGLFLCQGYS